MFLNNYQILSKETIAGSGAKTRWDLAQCHECELVQSMIYLSKDDFPL